MARKPVEIRGESTHYDFEGLSCCGCGKPLVEGNVYALVVPMLPRVVTEDNLFCSGCAVSTVRQNGGATHKVLPQAKRVAKRKLGDGEHETGEREGSALHAHGEGVVTRKGAAKAARELKGEAAAVAKEKSDG